MSSQTDDTVGWLTAKHTGHLDEAHVSYYINTVIPLTTMAGGWHGMYERVRLDGKKTNKQD